MPETKSLEMRKVVDDFIDFANQVSNLESDTERYYWIEEAILKAADKIKEIEER